MSHDATKLFRQLASPTQTDTQIVLPLTPVYEATSSPRHTDPESLFQFSLDVVYTTETRRQAGSVLKGGG